MDVEILYFSILDIKAFSWKLAFSIGLKFNVILCTESVLVKYLVSLELSVAASIEAQCQC